MSVVRVDALCECDGCQKRFGVELDLNSKMNETFPDFESLAREEILGGQANYYVWGVRGKATVDRLSLKGFPTIQGGLMLCDDCTKKCDALPIERDLTLYEVQAALGLPHDPT